MECLRPDDLFYIAISIYLIAALIYQIKTGWRHFLD